MQDITKYIINNYKIFNQYKSNIIFNYQLDHIKLIKNYYKIFYYTENNFYMNYKINKTYIKNIKLDYYTLYNYINQIITMFLTSIGYRIITSVYNIIPIPLPNIFKPILGGNSTYYGITDTLQIVPTLQGDLLEVLSAFIGIDDQNAWIKNIDNNYIYTDQQIIVNNTNVYIAYNSSQDIIEGV